MPYIEFGGDSLGVERKQETKPEVAGWNMDIVAIGMEHLR